jgi:hypothetical protein
VNQARLNLLFSLAPFLSLWLHKATQKILRPAECLVTVSVMVSGLDRQRSKGLKKNVRGIQRLGLGNIAIWWLIFSRQMANLSGGVALSLRMEEVKPAHDSGSDHHHGEGGEEQRKDFPDSPGPSLFENSHQPVRVAEGKPDNQKIKN